MAITDRTRKMLWGRSGNRCAICRRELVIERTLLDVEAIVGNECHIVSGAPNGPRFDPNFPTVEIDTVDNLMLLCSVHHTIVDAQIETYTPDVLRLLKRNHESWAKSRLDEDPLANWPKLRRFKQNIPKQLMLIEPGQRLVSLAPVFHGYYQHHPEHLNEAETDAVGLFFEEIDDYMTIVDDVGSAFRLQMIRSIDKRLLDLKELGFLVFAAAERQRMEGGTMPPSDWYMLHLAVERAETLLVNLEERIKVEKPTTSSPAGDPEH